MIQKRTSFIILIFSLMGAAAAGVSYYEHTLMQAGAMAGPSLCNIGGQFNCDAINKSEYATVLGVPLAAFGLSFYMIAAIGALVSIFSGLGLASLGVYLIASFFSVMLSFYLFFISKFVIGYFCLFCLIMYGANIGIFLSSLRAARGSVGHVLHQGLFAPGEFLMNLLTGEKKFFTWCFLLLSLGALYGVYAAPTYITQSVAGKLAAENSFYLSVWKKEQVVSIPVKKGNAVEGDYTTGTGNSIDVVEYSDFECPACRMFYAKVEKILEKYKDRISFTAKNFPLDRACNRMLQRDIHQHSCDIANFVRCSGEQGKFWEAYHQAFTDKAMEKEGEPVLPTLMSWASGAGLDSEAIQSCLSSGRQLIKIKSEIEEAISFELQSTPTIFVNGRKTNPQHFEDIIEELAKR